MKQVPIKVLFVCMGNICRSPMAEGMFRHLVANEGLSDNIQTDSAGTHAYHVGEAPDPRAQTTMKNHGITITDLRARRFEPADFSDFHYIVAMDRENLAVLKKYCPKELHVRVRLFMEFATTPSHNEVPDPYYGGTQGFELVYKLVESASEGLLQEIKSQHSLVTE